MLIGALSNVKDRSWDALTNHSLKLLELVRQTLTPT